MALSDFLSRPSIATNSPTKRRIRNHDSHAFFALHLHPSTSPEVIARSFDARHEGQIGELENHHKFSVEKDKATSLDTTLSRHTLRLRRGNTTSRDYDEGHQPHGIIWSQRLLSKSHFNKRRPPPLLHLNTSGWTENVKAVSARTALRDQVGISDPTFKDQWHLFNTIQVGQDMNVSGLWLEGITGKNIVTAFVDDGLDTQSLDLKDNYFPQGSFDFNEISETPTPRKSTDAHGTMCAAAVAAAKNGICGIGIAYESQVAGIRLLSGPIDESDEAASINYRFHDNHIYSCSWGPPDNGDVMSGPGLIFQRALMNGVQKGRHGKGSIYVFAAGNGGWLGDDCNFDGYTNSIYTVTVGAITREGKHPEYSEPCAAQLAVAYSSAGYESSGLDAITTTGVGDECSSGFGGTSAAGPLAAGAIALALSVRPDLTWRDIQYLLQDTAVPIEGPDGGEWQISSTGHRFSHVFGFGKIDTYALVHAARGWTSVNPQAWYHSPWLRVDLPIPQGPLGLTSSFDVTQETMILSNLKRLEHITITINIIHTRRGDLSVELHSPTGMISYLAKEREKDDEQAGLHDWNFMTVANWGESAVGRWSLVVKDNQINRFSGTFINWRLNLWGEAIDIESQPLHPFPSDDQEHDEVLQVGAQPLSNFNVVEGQRPSHGSLLSTDRMESPTSIWFPLSLVLVLASIVFIAIQLASKLRRRSSVKPGSRGRTKASWTVLDGAVAL